MPNSIHRRSLAGNNKIIFVRRLLLFLFLLLVVSYASSCMAEAAVELSSLTAHELKEFMEDIDRELELHHTPQSDVTDSILSATEDAVESYFLQQGIQISWAWVHYDYTREWDFYTLTTHIDYKDAKGKKQKPDVYAEAFPRNGDFSVYYLLVGTEVIINRRAELPDQLWAETPEGITNAATGLNLSTISAADLSTLKSRINEEISANHTPKSSISDLVLSLTKVDVEQFFAKQGIEISWAWINYTYTCDWGFYTLKTHIDYKDKSGSWQKPDVYAEAYPENGKYVLFYLMVGDQTLIDQRNRLPENMAAALETGQATAAPKVTITPAPTQAQTNTPAPTQAPAITSAPATPGTTSALSAMTVDNNEEFAAILVSGDAPQLYREFVAKHKGRMIEFDGNIAYMNNHGTYKTRYDILIYGGDYGDRYRGPSFQFNDVSVSDLHLTGPEIPDTVSAGLNLHIIAEIVEYTKGDLILLDPISITLKAKPVNTPAAGESTSEPYSYHGPAYEIVDSHSTGIGLTQYWVYTGKFDYSTDAYRELVKAIIADVAHRENTEKLSVSIVTDKEIVYFESSNTIEKYMNQYGIAYFKKVIAPKEQTDWVALYTGGYDINTGKLSDAGSAFEITWFIAEHTDREDEMIEQWRPAMLGPHAYSLLKKGTKGNDVRVLQERLKALGYYAAAITGTFDNNTITSLKSFEKANGLKIDGSASIEDQKLIFSGDAVSRPTPTPKPTKKPTPTPRPTRTPDPRKAYGTFNFKNASKYPEKYRGTQVKITGTVLQAMGNRSEGFQLRVASKGNYDDVVLILVPLAAENILEDDRIIFYCYLDGTMTYETIFGAEVTLPLLYCHFYEYR